MKIEAGKFYKTAEGEKVGPAEIITYSSSRSSIYIWDIPYRGYTRAYNADGVYCLYAEGYGDNYKKENIVSEWIEEESKEVTAETYKRWGEMTPDEKGALLLAHHEGKTIEISYYGMRSWSRVREPSFNAAHFYRVKPEEPMIEQVEKHEDGSATYTFNFDDETINKLAELGTRFALYCEAYRWDVQDALDNLKR